MVEEWAEKAELAKSAIEFTRRLHTVAEDAFLGLVGSGSDLGFRGFETVNGRPCVMAVAIGPEASRIMLEFAKYLKTQDLEEDDNEE